MFNQMKLWLFIPFLFFIVSKVKAQVIINEFSSNSDPEWVELYNSFNEIVNLTEWKITDGNTSTSDDLILNGCIANQGFRSFSRSSGWLNDTGGDTINLKDSNGNQIDQVIYGSGGIVGIPQSGRSASRVPDGNQSWVILDSATQQNDNCQIFPTPSPSPVSTPIQTPTAIPSPTPNDFSGLFISEYLPYPDSENEWVEIYNSNDFEVNLNGWFVDDISDEGSAPIVITGIITPKSYKVFYLSIAFLNNSGDDVRLLNGNKIERDKTSFESSIKNKSWAKDANNKWCQVDPAPNFSNPNCPDPTPIAISTPTPILAPSPSAPVGTSTPTPTPKPSPKVSPSPILVETATPSASSEVLAAETKRQIPIIELLLVITGVGLVIASGVMAGIKFAKARHEWDNRF